MTQPTSTHGYPLVYLGVNDPRAYGNGNAYEHRLVAERMLGRTLREGEIVRFINGRRRDVRPENLEVVQTHPKVRRRRPSPAQDIALAALRRLGGEATTEQIAEVIGRTNDNTRSTMRQSASMGRARRDRGRWVTVDAGGATNER